MFDAEEADDVERLGQHLEERDLAESGGRDAFFVHLQASLLQGDQLAGGFVLGLVHLAVGPFPDLLELLVLVHIAPDCSQYENPRILNFRLSLFSVRSNRSVRL